MNQMLEIGQKVTCETSGMSCCIEQFIGAGGQGEVYKASLSGQTVALKWYFSSQATPEQKHALETLVHRGAPNDRFLWPLELVQSEGTPGFGYLMPLRPAGYKNIIDLMKRRVDPTFRALATAGFELADSFKQLHAKGLCYRDISFDNVFLECSNGSILICDNDNVAIDGQASSGVLGTPRFMAPEVVRGEAKPNSHTDLFSLAVLLFYLLMVHHPLEGKKEVSIKCFDLPAMNKLYGYEPLFIFHPTDHSNEPVKGYHENALSFWLLYPTFLRELFTRAFTEGISDPINGRVMEGEWRSAMIRLRDSILYCHKCGSENFYDQEIIQSGSGHSNLCWNCGANVAIPFRIKLGKNVVMLNHDTTLYPHHIDENRDFDFSEPMAKVVRHPIDPSLWGLQNLSGSKWFCTGADGSITDVDPGRSASLKSGVRVNFGTVEGEIRSS